MAKYHINHKGEVKLCRAQIKCRFGGASGSENHFEDRSKAEQKAQKDLSQKYGQLNSGVQKTRPTAEENLIRGLKDKGYRVSRVSSIKSHRFERGSGVSGSSQIDILDERPDKELIQQIRAGEYRQFA